MLQNHVPALAFIRNKTDHWSLQTAAGIWSTMLTELSLKWCWKIFNLVHCLQAAETLRQNLQNKESLVLHKWLEMWAMDSASLYSGESIITEDAMQDRGKKKDKERREKEIQADQRYSKKEEEEAASREMLRISNVLQACLCHFVLVKGCRRNYPLAWLRQSALWWGFDGFQQEHLTIAAGLDFLLKATETSSVGRAVIEG